MLVWRWNSCRSPTMGEKYERPLPLSSGLNSSLALSCGLLVIAPNSPHVVSLSAFTVRSGSALPSVHQNFQPISHGTYSASNFIRSRTIRAASITSFPTPSPGIHAILYLAIGGRLYRCLINPQASPVVFEPTTDYADKRINSAEQSSSRQADVHGIWVHKLRPHPENSRQTIDIFLTNEQERTIKSSG